MRRSGCGAISNFAALQTVGGDLSLLNVDAIALLALPVQFPSLFDVGGTVRLQRIASNANVPVARRTLSAKDYERLAMAVFGELIARDAAAAQKQKLESSGLAASLAYGDGAVVLEKHKSLDPCWRRLKQDLYSGERGAFVGVRLALS